MPIRLRKRELPSVKFRRVLPEYLGPGGECFIEIEARPAGSLNPAYVAAVEDVMRGFRLTSRKLEKLNKADDDAGFVAADEKAAMEVTRNRWGALYDACVIGWTSNIQTEDDNGNTAAITCDRATFLALTEERIPTIANALIDFEAACKDAGKAIQEDDEALAKNS